MLGKSLKMSGLSRAALLSALAVAAAGGYFAGSRAETGAPALFRITPLLTTDKTVMDERIVYPTSGPAELTAAIMALAPGAETPWHVHNVPLAGIVLDGEITVDYGDKGTRTFKTGEAIAEAMQGPHRGMNKSDQPVRVFVLYMGAKGVPTTTGVGRAGSDPRFNENPATWE